MIRRSGRWRRVSIDVYALTPIVTLHWAIKRKADLLDARDGADIFFEPAVERLQSFRLIPSHLRVNVQDVSIRSIKAEVAMLHVVHASRQQSRGTQEHERQRG